MTEYEALIAALEATGIPFAEDGWDAETPLTRPAAPYGVYQIEGGASALWTDDRPRRQTLQGSVDVFTLSDGHTEKQSVQTALISSGVRWYLSSRQYEDNTRLTHLEWVFYVDAHPAGGGRANG